MRKIYIMLLMSSVVLLTACDMLDSSLREK